MQVTVDVTQDDLWRATRAMAWRNQVTRRNVIGSVLAPPLVSLALVVFAGLPWGVSGLLVVAGTLAGWAALWRITRRQVVRLQQPGVVGEHVITLTPQGVREQTSVNDCTMAWSSIEVVRDDHALYLMIGPLMGHVIPWRCFNDAEEAAAFEAAARAFAGASGGHQEHAPGVEVDHQG